MSDFPPEFSTAKKSGFVAIVGKPNVGKSTLLNYMVGQKLSITSRKPQTTRHRICGIKTTQDCQIVFVDTPGLHSDQDKAINRYMNRTVHSVIKDVDLTLFVVDRLKWTTEDEKVLESLSNTSSPVMLLLNKTDLMENKSQLLPYIEEISQKFPFAEIFPLSALRNQNLEALEQKIIDYLPESDFFLYPEDQLTDRNVRFLAAEFIREKITRQIGDELPYELTVEIEEFKQIKGTIHISALILVERAGQKKILRCITKRCLNPLF